jgi:hypothetical protein
MDFVSGILGSFYILLCWSGLYFGIKYYLQLQEQTQQTLKATSAAHQAQGATEDAALPAQPAFSVQHAERHLDIDTRWQERYRQPGSQPPE